MSEETKLSETEKLIREKMRAGLSRDQAVAVVTSQEDHDAALAKAEKAAAKAPKSDKNGEKTAEK